jgi:hypothetical protein
MTQLQLAEELASLLGDEFAELSEGQKERCVTRYEEKRKGAVIYLFWFFNFHYAYVGRWKLFSVFFISLGGLGIWWLIDLFRMDTILKDGNSLVAQKIVQEIKGEA